MGYVSTWMGDRFSALTQSLMALQLVLVDRNPFQPCFFFLSPDYHELWHSMRSACLLTEIKRQWATQVLGWETASVHYSFF